MSAKTDFDDFNTRVWINGAELAIRWCAVIGNLMLIYLIIKAHTFHLHLKIICCNVFFGYVLILLLRCAENVTATFKISTPYPIVFFRNVTATYYLQSQWSILAEQVWATVNARDYEFYRNPICAIVIAAFTWAFAAGTHLVYKQNDAMQLVVTIFDILLNLGVIVGNIQLLRYNRNQTIKMQQSSMIRLSERYQRCENIRTTLIFYQLAIAIAVGNILVLIAVWIVNNWMVPDEFILGQILMKHIYSMIPTGLFFLFPILTIRKHPELRKLFLKCLLNMEVVRSEPVEMYQMQTVTGSRSRLTTPNPSEQDIYFEQLANDWK